MQVFECLTERFDLVQIPVVPLVDRSSRWVAGHYLDEFADHHGRTIVAREAIGAGLPSAGVGCAFSRDMLGRIAASRSGRPFDADSLTEDYELGLRIAEMGGRTIFVRIASGNCGGLVAVRAHFPGALDAAVRQKARWMAGIALSGWDRLGWRGGLAERWMRLYDRRAILNALVLIAAYCALVLNALLSVVMSDQYVGGPIGAFSPATTVLLRICMALLVWRLVVRACLVARTYGWREGLRSVPRAFIGNIIAMMAARRAVAIYLRARRDGLVCWDKTAHRFPTDLSTAR
jgi:adsorption protein B